MEIKIGLQSTRELVVDLDVSPDDLKTQLDAADGGLVTLTDRRGRTTLVSSAKVAYVEFGGPSQGTVGYRS